ncbi:EamA family transporter RarD [Yinghuangia sp. ASG 101]|uniref:EamA family transporter RarD n=1 Tax=Yinghuangia sp. ASG 101 TaxID=2896848 RepID=UPI001E3885F6|nr:EamA family transporter RarD [Yinghuangia sp. ASG 101]UGQ11803.1 EamA family transporter RarD [Yinghuangia sp. ASG 101]
MTPAQRGPYLALSAYAIWGLFPLYWPLLEPAGPVELLAHRTVWSFVAMAGLLAVRRRAWFRELIRSPVVFGRLTLAAATLSFNWGLYIYGVNHGHVVEAALGYFIAPLVMTGAGVLILGEQLRLGQWAAVFLGVAAVLVLVTTYGQVPWLALALAGSWAVYGYLKRTAQLPAPVSLTVETAAMLVPAVAYLAWLASQGKGTFGTVGTGHALLLMSTATAAVPLLLFAAAANKVPLSTLGMTQYVEPAMQFVIGITIRHEPMPTARWAGFLLVWSALVLLAYDARGRAAPA